MSGWSGGVFTRARNWAQDKLNNINPQAALFDQEDDNFATGLNNCVTKDGTNKPSATMDWNAQRLSNIADATAFTDASSYRQSGVYAVKSTGTIITSSSTLTDDPHLVLALTAGTWAIEQWISLCATTGGGGGFRWKFTFSGTSTSSGLAFQTNIASGSSALVTGIGGTPVTFPSITVAAGLSQSDFLRWTGVAVITVAGNIVFQWAQNSASVNSTNVNAGSWLKATKIA